MIYNPKNWMQWWDARVAAMESVLGNQDQVELHSPIPFEFGEELGGRADVILFKKHINGVVYATSDLIGRDEQIPNPLGNYELILCHREENNWAPVILSDLANYTLKAPLNPGDTLDITQVLPIGSTLAAFLFLSYAVFKVMDRSAGLLLCLGITEEELEICRTGRRKQVETALKEGGIFPYTDLFRESIV